MLGVSLVACSDDDDATTTTPGTTVTGSAAASGAGGGATTATGSGGATATTNATTTTGGGGSTKLWPLAVGNKWTYDLGEEGICGMGMQTMEVTGTSTVDSLEAFEVTGFCNGATANYAVGDGDEVLGRANNEWQPYLHGTLEDGQEWTYSGLPYVWEQEAGSVTVAAGTYSDCWRLKRDDDEVVAYQIYCRGVGLVRSVLSNQGQDFDAELASVDNIN